MQVQDISFFDSLENLQYDDRLLALADQGEGGEVLRFWESPVYFVVMGRSGVENDDVESDTVRVDGVSVFRRSSGGGTVVQGPGCFNFSLVLSVEKRSSLRLITGSYRVILDRVIAALGSVGVNAEFRPVCDLVTKSSERKFSGNAQRRGRRFILHHGTILYDFDLSLISRYLKMPLKMPEYRAVRAHDDFVTNISVSSQEIRRVLAQAFSVEF